MEREVILGEDGSVTAPDAGAAQSESHSEDHSAAPAPIASPRNYRACLSLPALPRVRRPRSDRQKGSETPDSDAQCDPSRDV